MRRGAMPARIRGLAVPTLLLDLLEGGRWYHPGEAALARVMPWFEDSLNFLASAQDVERESRALDHLVDDETTAQLFNLS